MVVLLAGLTVAEEWRVLGCELGVLGKSWGHWDRSPCKWEGVETAVGKQICEICVDAVSMFGFGCSLSAPQSWLSLGI